MRQQRVAGATAWRERLTAARRAGGGLPLLALVVAEVALLWLVASLLLITPDRSIDMLPPLPLFAVVYVAALLPRVLEACDVWEPGYGLAMSLGVVGTALLLVRAAAFPALAWSDSAWLSETGRSLILRPSTAALPPWALLLVVVYAWWRGRRRSDPTLDGAYTQFRLGTPVGLLAVVVHGVTGSPLSQRAVVGAVLVFFAASLLAIVVARLDRLVPAGVASDLGMRGRWFGTMVVPVAGVLATGVLIAGIASRDLLQTVLWALAPLLWGLSVIVRVLILVVALIAFIIVSPILWLLSGKELELRRVESNDQGNSFRDAVQREMERVMEIPDPLRYFLALMLLSAILTLLTRFILRRRRRPPVVPVEERASVFSPRDLMSALGARLRTLLGLLPREEEDPLAALRGDRRWRHTIAIRETYAAFLRRCAALGRPRPRGATPAEHAGHLRDLGAVRRQSAALRTLTEGYYAARYGADPATAAEAEQVRAAWRDLDRALRDQ